MPPTRQQVPPANTTGQAQQSGPEAAPAQGRRDRQQDQIGNSGVLARMPDSGRAGPVAGPEGGNGKEAGEVWAPAPKEVVEDNTLDLQAATTYADAVGAALRAAGPGPRAGTALAELTRVAHQIRDGATGLVSDSSVTKKDGEADPHLPSIEEIHAWNAAISRLVVSGTTLVDPQVQAALEGAIRAGADAALACFQARAVLQGRASWRTNQSEPAPTERNKADPEFKAVLAAARSGGIGLKDVDDKGVARKEVKDWCGFFVMSNLVRGAGLDTQHADSMHHTTNGVIFFSYNGIKDLKGKARGREPAFVWAEEAGRWMSVRAYHELRGSVRQLWGAQDDPKYKGKYPDVQEVLKSGVRPGDIVFRDTDRDGDGNHYGMVDGTSAEDGTLTTVEGNYQGVRADPKTGRAARTRGGELHEGGYPTFKDFDGTSRSKDGFAAVLIDTQADTKTKEAHGRTVDGFKTSRGSDIRVVGRPSVCDFEKHRYSATMPKDPTMSPEAMEQAKAKPAKAKPTKGR